MLDKNNFLIKSFGDFSLYLDKNDPGISATLLKPKYFRKWHREPGFMDIIEAEVHRGDIIFEVGANTQLLSELTVYLLKTNVKEGVNKFVDWYKSYYQINEV